MLNNLLVDSSFLIALYDLDSDEHDEVHEIAELFSAYLLVPQVILTPKHCDYLELFP